MEQTLLDAIGQLVANGPLAVLIFYIYRKDSQAWSERWQGEAEQLMQVVKENTAAITALLARMERP